MSLDTIKRLASLLEHYIDEWGMPQVRKDLLSWKDSLGRLILMWIAYYMPDELEIAINSCLYYNNKGKPRLRRHPGVWEKSSRDHWSYFIIFKKLQCNKYPEYVPFFKDFIGDLPRMRGMNLWVKTLIGNKRAERWYYRISIPGARIKYVWNWIISTIGALYKERSIHWWISEYENTGVTCGKHLQDSLTGWQKGFRKLLHPMYSLHIQGWQMFVMPESEKKEKLENILMKRVSKTNVMLRLLFNDRTVTWEEVRDYPNVSGYSPGVPMNEACDRDIHELSDQDNLYEKELMIWLWYYRNPLIIAEQQ